MWQEQLEALERAASLSQSDMAALRDIVYRGFRLQRCCRIAFLSCRAVWVVSIIGVILAPLRIVLEGTGHAPDPLWRIVFDASGIVVIASMVLMIFLYALGVGTYPGTYRQVANNLNQHFRGHAQNLSFEADGTRRFLVSLETGVEG